MSEPILIKCRCKSGAIGFQGRLQDHYRNLYDWIMQDSLYQLADRLGYDSAQEAWDDNPIIQKSSDLNDLCTVITDKEFPINVKIILDLEVDLCEGISTGLTKWEIMESVKQAIVHAVKHGEAEGHVHDLDNTISIILKDVVFPD